MTDDKKDPLQSLAVLIGFLYRIERELKVFVVVVSQVQQDGGRFKDNEVVSGSVDESRNSTIRVDLEVPWFLGQDEYPETPGPNIQPPFAGWFLS